MAASTWFHGSAWPPGNHGTMPDGQLPLGDGVDRRRQLGRRDGAFDVGEERHRLLAPVGAAGLSA